MPDRQETGATPPADYTIALEQTLENVHPLPGEVVDHGRAAGRVLRAPILADRDLPPCDRSRMDGYALRAADLHPDATMPVAGAIPAGSDGTLEVPAGSCVKIATGAPLPSGLDCVIEHERSDRGDPVRFTLESAAAWRSVHRRGVDARAGERLLEAGCRLRPHHLGLLATVGMTRVEVTRPLRVGVLSSGDEVVPADTTPADHQVREGNAPMIAATLEGFGATIVHRAHVSDAPDATRAALLESLAACDLLVTIGGISAGERDLIRPTLESIGVRWRVRRARIKPGKPVHVGANDDGVQVVCLPGNPVSALVTAHLFCRPLAARLNGREDDAGWTRHPLASPVAGDPQRRSFRPARLDETGRIVVPAWQGSGDLAHLAECTGIVDLESDTSTHRYLDWRTP